MSFETNFAHLNIQNGPLYHPTSRSGDSHTSRSSDSQYPNTRKWLPGMDVDHALNSRRNGYATMEDLTPLEEQERARHRATQERVEANYGNAQVVDQGVRFGMPSMGLRKGAHQKMGDRPAVLGTWDHRASRPE
ncbi:hypothetical protein PMIN01_10067 [Paraphaeosphaeria minitans]|uniref:Uncharacterized protein n=1 Tax=Paraphaeosphaeria minitans TaxID=565426 RepID=A0A9P6GBA6_9PLEO|nr:hypothetical protein PMIN01_10067 [Paraphaeosphaeria minitans]